MYVGIHLYYVSHSFVYLFLIFVEQSWCKHTHMSTCLVGWNRYRWRRGRRTHIWEGEVHAELNIFIWRWYVCIHRKYRHVWIIEIETFEHGVTSVYTSSEADRNRYIETYYNWSIQITSGHYRILVTYIHMYMARDVHEHGRGGRCVYMFRYIYAWIREIKMQMEGKDRRMGKVMWISISTVTQVHIEVEKIKQKKDVMNMEQTTKHSAHETQIDRQVEMKAYTLETNS